jgi:hypothetical protein
LTYRSSVAVVPRGGTAGSGSERISASHQDDDLWGCRNQVRQATRTRPPGRDARVCSGRSAGLMPSACRMVNRPEIYPHTFGDGIEPVAVGQEAPDRQGASKPLHSQFCHGTRPARYAIGIPSGECSSPHANTALGVRPAPRTPARLRWQALSRSRPGRPRCPHRRHDRRMVASFVNRGSWTTWPLQRRQVCTPTSCPTIVRGAEPFEVSPRTSWGLTAKGALRGPGRHP